METQFLTVKDVASLLHLSPRQILNLAKEDCPTPLPHIKVNGRALRFRLSDVNAWFEKNLVSSL